MTMKLNRSYLLFAVIIALIAAGGLSCSREAKRDRHLKRADRYFESKQYDNAVIEYLNVLRLEQTNSFVLRRIGLAYYEKGKISSATPFFIESEKHYTDD